MRGHERKKESKGTKGNKKGDGRKQRRRGDWRQKRIRGYKSRRKKTVKETMEGNRGGDSRQTNQQ